MRALLAVALVSWISGANAQDVRYDPDAKYVRLLVVDSIELSTQLWLAVRAHTEPKKIEELGAPVIGFKWSEESAECRVRAIPTIGIDAYKHLAVGYFLEISAQSRDSTVSAVCLKPLENLNHWYLSLVLNGQVDKHGYRDVYVRDFRAVDPDVDTRWKAVKGKELMQADAVIESITGGQK